MLPGIKVVDNANNAEEIESIEDLTQTGLSILWFACKTLLGEIRDAEARLEE